MVDCGFSVVKTESFSEEELETGFSLRQEPVGSS
jgi:hypothetical protein